MVAIIRALVGLAFLAGCAAGHAAPSGGHQSVRVIYDDLDRFQAALKAVDGGASAVKTFDAYVRQASSPYPFYAERYGASGESIAAAVAKRPRHYRRVAALKPQLQSMEPTLSKGLDRLNGLIGGITTPPIYILVGNMTAGGIHARLTPPIEGHISAPAILLEAVSMSSETDMSEFPGNYGGGHLVDVPYVAIHEMVHAYQARVMGMGNYVSIYSPGPGNTYLAAALREGCADYVTFLATGTRRTGKQQEYGLAHEAELWTRFKTVMNSPLSFEDGWFGALDPKTPDWPPQIGYWLGSRICQTYHEEASDKAAAIRDIFGAYSPEHMQKILAPYARRSALSE